MGTNKPLFNPLKRQNIKGAQESRHASESSLVSPLLPLQSKVYLLNKRQIMNKMQN